MSAKIITGANSFIGQALVNELVARGNEVCAVIGEASSASKLNALGPVCRVYRCDMAHYSDLSSILPPDTYDVCIHLAWAGSSGDARADWGMQLADAAHSCDLVTAVASMGVSRFIGVGTLAEIDVMSYALDDGATPKAVSIYGMSKIAAHLTTKAVCSALGVGHIWCRLVNVYGPGNTTGNFADMASRRFLKGERPSFTEGTQAYDFIYVDDVARALAAVAEDGHSGCTYLIGSGEPRPLREYIQMIRDAAAPGAEIYFGEVPFKGKALDYDSYDVAKLREHTGFSPSVSFLEGIEKTIDWLKETM